MANTRVAALIMAGGRSERMRAGGSDQHKGLRTVLGVPLIERNLNALLCSGFKELFVAISAREQGLAEWIERRGRAIAHAEAAALEVLVELEPRGTIGAVASLPRDVTDALIVNVDNLTTLDLGALIHFHRDHDAAATIATHEQAFPIPFGMLELSGHLVVAYREKPKLSVPISSGTYVISRRAIDRVPGDRRMDVPELVDLLLESEEAVLAFPHQDLWIDVNDEAALADAHRLFSAANTVRAEP